jgi:hypothetical protein
MSTILGWGSCWEWGWGWNPKRTDSRHPKDNAFCLSALLLSVCSLRPLRDVRRGFLGTFVFQKPLALGGERWR